VADAPENGDGNAAPAIDLVKTAPEDDAETEEEGAAGPSLADVLAEDEDTELEPQPAAGGMEEHEPAPATPAAGPANVALVLTTPRAAPTAPAVHVAIPAPAPAAEAEPTQRAVDDEPAEDPASDSQPAAPAVLLLGPISIEGATGRVDSNRLTASIELVAYLALNPGVDHHAIDDAL
jgi:hypothetical protein